MNGYSRLLNHYVNGTAFLPKRWKKLVIEADLPLTTPSQISHLAISRLNESSVQLAVAGDSLLVSIGADGSALAESSDDRVRMLIYDLMGEWPSAVRALFVHGSVADGTVVPYSDVDAALLLDVKVTEEELKAVRQRVMQACKHILEFQPDQHHGILVIPYSESVPIPSEVLPIPVARTLKSVFRSNDLDHLTIVPTSSRQAARSLTNAVATAREPSSSYQAMKLLSQVMLLPAIEERALGNEISKRHGIKVWLESSRPRSVAMEIASAARQAWPASHVERTKWYYRLPANPWLASSLRRRIVAVPREVASYVDSHAISVFRSAGEAALATIESRRRM